MDEWQRLKEDNGLTIVHCIPLIKKKKLHVADVYGSKSLYGSLNHFLLKRLPVFPTVWFGVKLLLLSFITV